MSVVGNSSCVAGDTTSSIPQRQAGVDQMKAGYWERYDVRTGQFSSAIDGGSVCGDDLSGFSTDFASGLKPFLYLRTDDRSSHYSAAGLLRGAHGNPPMLSRNLVEVTLVVSAPPFNDFYFTLRMFIYYDNPNTGSIAYHP